MDEFIKRPLRDFHDAVVERRLKAGVGFFRDRVLNLVERIAQRDFGSDLRDRVTRRFRSQRGGTADTGVYLDDAVFKAFGIQRKLYVAAALHFQLVDDCDRRAAQHLDFLIRQSLAGRNNNGVAV